MKSSTAAIAARLDVLSLTLQGICRALPPPQAAAVGTELRVRVAALLADAESLPVDVDEALTAELASQLAALGCA